MRKKPLTRSEIMSRVRGKDTGPEKTVRSFLYAAGLRYRLHIKKLPGCPDLTFSSRRCVVFVHGCFWHRHPGCPRTRTPKSSIDFWERKFEENVQRDKAAAEALEQAGWKVLTIWECETQDQAKLDELVRTIKEMKVR